MKFTEVKISGLKNGEHHFTFDLNSSFLAPFSNQFFDNPSIQVEAHLVLSETMIKADLKLEGTIELVCDRSLEPFLSPVSIQETHFFKYGLEEKELTDELEVISKERISIDFDQLVYDLVALSVPGKKLHPRFAAEEAEDEEEGKVIFTTLRPNEVEETSPDPRWAKLTDIHN